MEHLELTQALIKELFDYREGKLFRKKVTASSVKIGMRAGYVDPSHGYRRVSIGNKHFYEHRIIWFLHNGYFAKYIDHINKDKADNRIENLRECNMSQNIANSGKRKQNASGFKGVVARGKRWKAYIQVNRKRLYLGSYKTKEIASEAYLRGAKKYFGEFASL